MSYIMKLTFLLLFLLLNYESSAQGAPAVPAVSKGFITYNQANNSKRHQVRESDTSKENKEPRYFYVTGSTNVLVNTIGGFAKRFSPSIEFGRTYGIFDIGLATGRLNMNAGGDTSQFIEIRPTINIFSKGRFSEALCLGGGYIFSAQQGLLTEICNSINFNVSETIAIAVAQGYYFMDGTASNRTAQYMGVNLTYNLLKKNSVNKKRKRAAIINEN